MTWSCRRCINKTNIIKCKQKWSILQVQTLTSFTGFDCSVNQSLTTSHGVEIELCWSKSGKVGILHKPSTLRTIIIFDEVRKCAVTETKWNPFTFNILLAYHSNNLNMSGKYIGNVSWKSLTQWRSKLRKLLEKTLPKPNIILTSKDFIGHHVIHCLLIASVPTHLHYWQSPGL